MALSVGRRSNLAVGYSVVSPRWQSHFPFVFARSECDEAILGRCIRLLRSAHKGKEDHNASFIFACLRRSGLYR
jgi:hypothetical protein